MKLPPEPLCPCCRQHYPYGDPRAVFGTPCFDCIGSGRAKRIDQYVNVGGVGITLDLGWAWGVLNGDETFTRTCKGCGITVTSPINAAGDVMPLPIMHKDQCPVLARLGNNPTLS